MCLCNFGSLSYIHENINDSCFTGFKKNRGIERHTKTILNQKTILFSAFPLMYHNRKPIDIVG